VGDGDEGGGVAKDVEDGTGRYLRQLYLSVILALDRLSEWHS